MENDGWQTVRYGSRRRRTRSPYWGGYGGSGQGMARAFTPSFGRGYLYSSSNQPVPSIWTPKYPGTQKQHFRSYADAARPEHQRPARRWGSPVTGDPGARREAAEPGFGRLIRKTYGVIKLVHHLQNVSLKPGTQQPAMITKMVGILGDMIKPAYPTQQTMDLVWGNARNWGYTTRQILMEHYERELEKSLKDLFEMDNKEWRSAFGVAVRWAKRNLCRITQVVLDHAEAHIMAKLEGDKVQDSSQMSQLRLGRDQGTSTEDPTDQDRPQIVDADPLRVEKGKHSKTTVATMTDKQDTDLPGTSSRPVFPLEKRETRKTGHKSNKSVAFTEGSPSQRSEWGRSQDEVLRQVADELDCLETHPEANEPFPGWGTQTEKERRVEFENTKSVEGEVEADPEPDYGNFDLGEDYLEWSEDEDSEPEQTEDSDPNQARSGVYKHPRTNRKDKYWHLQVKEKCLIIGDSNLSNIPRHSFKNMQIESFPGANFRHAQNLLKKATIVQDLMVEQVVLSFGICDSKNKPKETIWKTCMKARKACVDKFPLAAIWIPLVNYSVALPKEEQDNLDTFNSMLQERPYHIPLLPKDKFQTVDQVHWTRDTGRAMLKHWTCMLGLDNPWVPSVMGAGDHSHHKQMK